MLLTLSNLTSSLVSINSLPASLKPGTTRTLTLLDADFTKDVNNELNALKAAGHISFSTSEDPDIDDSLEHTSIGTFKLYRVAMDDAADVTGGGTTQTVGFTVKNFVNKAIDFKTKLVFAVNDDIGLTQPSSDATLNTATAGTILDGAGTNTLIVETDAIGRFECTLTETNDKVVYLSCDTTHGSHDVARNEFDSVEFSA